MKNNMHLALPLQKCIRGDDITTLSDMELLAVIVGTGSKNNDVMSLSVKMIMEHGGLYGLLASGLREIAKVKGVGLKKAVRIHAAFEIGRRALTDPNTSLTINTPEKAWQTLLPEMAGLQKEEFWVLVLNKKNRLLKKCAVSIGTISETIVHPREVFRCAIREGGSGIIIAHNHPSGVILPSEEDISITERVAEAGEIIGIPLIDHIIISNNAFASMKEIGFI
jgi:DNA repair protein RadC